MSEGQVGHDVFMVDAKHACGTAAAGREKSQGIVVRAKEHFLTLARFWGEPSQRLHSFAVDGRYIFEQGVAGSNQKIAS